MRVSVFGLLYGPRGVARGEPSAGWERCATAGRVSLWVTAAGLPAPSCVLQGSNFSPARARWVSGDADSPARGPVSVVRMRDAKNVMLCYVMLSRHRFFMSPNRKRPIAVVYTSSPIEKTAANQK